MCFISELKAETPLILFGVACGLSVLLTLNYIEARNAEEMSAAQEKARRLNESDTSERDASGHLEELMQRLSKTMSHEPGRGHSDQSPAEMPA